MVDKQEMEKTSQPVNDPGKTAAIIGGLIATIPVGYGIARGALGAGSLLGNIKNPFKSPTSVLDYVREHGVPPPEGYGKNPVEELNAVEPGLGEVFDIPV